MASDAPTRRGPGRPHGTTKKKEGDKTITLTLSRRQLEYLRWLADSTYLGHSPELIVQKLLADKLEEMNPSNLQPPT